MSNGNYRCDSRVLRELGVRSWINAASWRTVFGGSCLDERVISAMNEAASAWVDMHELIEKAGKRVADLCQVESAYITCGCAAGQELVVAACITGADASKWKKLPFTEGMPNEVTIPRGHHIKYSPHWQAPGAKLVDYGNIATWETKKEEIAGAITDKTCCLAYVESHDVDSRQKIWLEDVIEVAQDFDLPVVIDAAAMLPPVDNLHKYTDMGADIAIFSGGKAIRAPNNTGIVLGRGERARRIIEGIRNLAFPYMGWGRSRKISKEQIVGLVTALEIFVKEGDQQYEEQMRLAKYFEEYFKEISDVDVCIIPNDSSFYEHPAMSHVPRVKLEWNPAVIRLTLSDLDRQLAEEDPPIMVKTDILFHNHYSDWPACVIDTALLREGEADLVAERIGKILKLNRASKDS